MPRTRHDGVPFSRSSWKGDAQRASKVGQRFRFRAICVQARGDWSWLKQALGLQGWQGKKSTSRCCFKCRCTRAEMCSVGPDVKWRRTLITDAEFMDDLISGNQIFVGLFRLPGWSLDFVVVDAMHAGYLGPGWTNRDKHETTRSFFHNTWKYGT